MTDTLPAGTTYITSSGGLGSVYDPGEHQIVWDLGSVPSGTSDILLAVVVPSDGGLPGQTIVNEAELAFGAVSATVGAESSVITPALAIRFPDGSAPPDPLEICAGEVVTLSAFSNRAGPLSYAWDLGDGSSADTRQISHSWAYGTYTVTATTTNTYGWVEHDTLAVYANPPPDAAFLSNSPVDLGQLARFTDTSIYSPTAWAWDFGDGVGQSNEQHPVYLYTSAGVYTVTLAASNACGTDLMTDAFEVLPPPCDPVQTAAISGPVELAVGQEGLYSASYAPPTATQPVTITWDAGDVGPTAVYSWTMPGTYAIAATATNPCGQAAAALTVTVLGDCEPVQTAAISGPVTLAVGQEGLYSASYTPPTATQPVTITWTAGDVGSTAVYSWTVPGTYTLTITVTNPCSTVGATFTVEVQEMPVQHHIYLPLIVRG